MILRFYTVARRIDPSEYRVLVSNVHGGAESIQYDALIVGTGPVPVTPPIAGLDRLGPAEGVHLLHAIGDTLALTQTLERQAIERAVIVGAG